MPQFPFFADISKKKTVVIGSGKKAMEKLERLKPFCENLVVIPSADSADWEEMLTDAFLVIAAEECREKSMAIACWCRERNILVNAVDIPEYCDFFFPSIICDGALSIGISTGGKVPGAAMEIRKRIGAVLPENMGELLVWLEKERSRIRTEVEDEKERARLIREAVCRCLETGCIPEEK